MHDANVFAVGPDKADFRSADILVYARAGVSLWRRVMRSAGYGFLPSVVDIRLAQFMPRQKLIQAVNTSLKGKEELKTQHLAIFFVETGNISGTKNRTVRKVRERSPHNNVRKLISSCANKGH